MSTSSNNTNETLSKHEKHLQKSKLSQAEKPAELCQNRQRNKRTIAEGHGSFKLEVRRVRMSVKLVAVILALAISAAYASPATSAQRSNYIEQENSCRQVCGLCDCDGFYCEDECICECNLEEDESEKKFVGS